MNEDVPKERLPQTMSLQERLAFAQKVSSEHDVALDLLQEKRYKEALKKLKWVWAQNSSYDPFLSRREITELIKLYPPAVLPIKRWRNDKERLIRIGHGDYKLVSQWNTLNEALGEKNRTFDVFLELEKSGADPQWLNTILICIWEKFAQKKQYEQLRGYLKSLAISLLSSSNSYDSAILFPGFPKCSRREHRKALQRQKDFMSTHGITSYEVALGLGEKRVAAEFARKILSVETSDAIYAGLIKAAIRARAHSEAIVLFEDAQASFTSRQLRHSKKAFAAMPRASLPKLV